MKARGLLLTSLLLLVCINGIQGDFSLFNLIRLGSRRFSSIPPAVQSNHSNTTQSSLISRLKSKCSQVFNKLVCQSVSTKESTNIPFRVQIPDHLQHLVLLDIASLRQLSKCLLVSKSWESFIRKHILDIPQFSSQQGFLQQVAEGSLGNSPKLVAFLSNPPFHHKMCIVAERMWFYAVIHLGRVEALQEWFQRTASTRRVSLHLLNGIKTIGDILFELEQDGFIADTRIKESHLEPLLRWYLDTLKHLYLDNYIAVGQYIDHLFAFAIEKGIYTLVHDPYFTHQRRVWAVGLDESPRMRMQLSHSVKTTNYTLLSQYFLYPLYRTTSMDTIVWAFEEGLGQCRVCQPGDIRTLVSRLVSSPEDVQQTLWIIMHNALIRGNLDMVRMLHQDFDLTGFTRTHMALAVFSGNMELIQYLESIPSSVHLTMDVLSQVAQGELHGWDDQSRLSCYSLNAFHHLIETMDEIPHHHVRHLLAVYSALACGSDREMTIFKKLVSMTHKPLTGRHLSYAIRRTPPYMCKRNESMQLVHYMLNDLEIIPQQHHLNEAVARGRLDIVKWVYEKGNRLGAAIYLTRGIIFRALTEDCKYSMEEPSLIRYLVDHMTLHSPEHIKQVADALLRRISTAPYYHDCYTNYLTLLI